MEEIKNTRIVYYDMERYPENCKECPAFKETYERSWNDSWTGHHCELGFFDDTNATQDIAYERQCHPDCKIRNCANVTVPNKVIKNVKNVNLLTIELGEDKNPIFFDVDWFVKDNFLTKDIEEEVVEVLVDDWVENADECYFEGVSECISDKQKEKIVEEVMNYIKKKNPKYTLKNVIKHLLDRNILGVKWEVPYAKEKIIYDLLNKLTAEKKKEE